MNKPKIVSPEELERFNREAADRAKRRPEHRWVAFASTNMDGLRTLWNCAQCGIEKKGSAQYKPCAGE